MRFLYTALFAAVGWGFWSVYDARKEPGFASAAAVYFILMGIGLYLAFTGVPGIGFPFFWGAWALYTLTGVWRIIKLDGTAETLYPEAKASRRH